MRIKVSYNEDSSICKKLLIQRKVTKKLLNLKNGLFCKIRVLNPIKSRMQIKSVFIELKIQ